MTVSSGGKITNKIFIIKQSIPNNYGKKRYTFHFFNVG